VVSALHASGTLAVYAGRLDLAEERLEEAVALARDMGYRVSEAQALGNLGVLAMKRKDLPTATTRFDQALSRLDGAERPDVLGRLLKDAGVAERRAGNADRARTLFQRRLRLSEKMDDFVAMANSLLDLASVALDAGELDEARDLIERALPIASESGDLKVAAAAYRCLGFVAMEGGDPEAAWAHYQNSLALARMRSDKWEQDETERYLNDLKERFGDRVSVADGAVRLSSGAT
jgi:tetratricopeptide (TPR) repeat protein